MTKIVNALTLGDILASKYDMTYNADNQGIKHDQGKQRFDLLPFDLMDDEQKVWEFGANKYAPNNWRKGMPTTQAVNAAMRHLTAYMMGENKDPESGLSHLGHAITSIRMAQNTERYFPDLDDRHKWSITKE